MHLASLSLIKYKRLLFSVNDNFLSKDVKLDADINYCIQVPQNINNALNEFYTLLVNLNETQDEIWNNIYHRTRSEISSFLENQVFEHQLILQPSKKETTDFISLFNSFAKNKNIRKAETFRLNAFRENNILAISYIKQKEQFICINFYRLTKERATNLSSFHLKHLCQNEYSASHFGRAHRALHWLDIKEFKSLNVENYDFCGWYNGAEDKALLSINQFKEQFTQNKVKEYSGVIYKNKLLSFLKKLR